MGLAQAARWEAESDKEITGLDKHGVFKLVQIASVPAGRNIVGGCSKLK